MLSRVDVMADRKIGFCASVPHEVFEELKDYRMFPNWFEAYKCVENIMKNYMDKHQYFCKQVKSCTNKSCPGACFALTANLVKEEMKKPQFVQKWHKLRRDLVDFLSCSTNKWRKSPLFRIKIKASKNNTAIKERYAINDNVPDVW